MKEIVNEILSDFDDAPKANTDIAGSIFILNETKAKIETNFLFRYFKAGLLVTFEILFVILTILTIVFGFKLIGEANEILNPIKYSVNVFDENQSNHEVIQMINLVKTSLNILVLVLTAFFFLLSRIFRRSRKRVFLMKSTCDNINQVIVNLKSVSLRV